MIAMQRADNDVVLVFEAQYLLSPALFGRRDI